MAAREHTLGELFAAYRHALVRRARALVDSTADAEDAVQDAMLAVLRAPHVLGGVERTAGWLYTIVQRRCVDILRKGGAHRARERADALAALFGDAPPAIDRLEHEEVVAAVARAVSALDEPLRFAFVENALEGRVFKDISAASGIPMGTLMARKQRAIELVKQRLCEEGILSSPKEKERKP
jgi:RNA polymerase sigma factor (sigma-70 family)